jgi:hypothetical protein
MQRCHVEILVHCWVVPAQHSWWLGEGAGAFNPTTGKKRASNPYVTVITSNRSHPSAGGTEILPRRFCVSGETF